MKSARAAPSDTSGIHLWLVLWKAFNALQAFAYQNIHASGLSLSDFAVLELLLHKGPQPVSTIGRKVLLSSGSITVAVDRLEQQPQRRDDARAVGAARRSRSCGTPGA